MPKPSVKVSGLPVLVKIAVGGRREGVRPLSEMALVVQKAVWDSKVPAHRVVVHFRDTGEFLGVGVL